VTRDEPGRRYVSLLEEVHQTRDSHLTGEHSSLDIRWRVLTTVRTEPSSDGVNVNTEYALDVLRHVHLLE
jgi:hypothetical protein